jgi:hypothetical protein
MKKILLSLRDCRLRQFMTSKPSFFTLEYIQLMGSQCCNLPLSEVVCLQAEDPGVRSLA